jgi:hypothetical protein
MRGPLRKFVDDPRRQRRCGVAAAMTIWGDPAR